MKPFPLLTVVFAASLLLAHGEQQPALMTDPPDGSEAPAPEVRAEFAPAEVLETTVTNQGGRDIIVQHLALDPNDPIIPVFPIPTTDPTEVSESVESTEDHTPTIPEAAATCIPMLSATVHPGPHTYLNWTHVSADGTSHEFSGWSNIDFNHLDSINEIVGTDGNQHTFIMGVGTESVSNGDIQPPPFESEAPTFIPDQADIPAEALVVVDSLHKIYAIDSEKLAAAHAGREAARLSEEAQEAELLANPPPPKDLIIRYRIAETPLPSSVEGGEQ